MTLSLETANKLLSLGIPAEKHTHEALRALMPPFEGLESVNDTQVLAEIVVYLANHNILSVNTASWKDLPWGTHACLFYKTDEELAPQYRNFFLEGLRHNEKCIWVVSKTYGMDKAKSLTKAVESEAGKVEGSIELIRHQDWYETPSGRMRTSNEIVMGWLNKIEAALQNGFGGVRVSGDAHCDPEDLKKFFTYEETVNGAIGSLRIKALCTYCVPRFAAEQIDDILHAHQVAFGDFATSIQA